MQMLVLCIFGFVIIWNYEFDGAKLHETTFIREGKMEKQIKVPGFVGFIASTAGRWLRVFVGLAIIIGGIRAATPAGNLLALLGIIPLAAGSFDFCVLGKLFAGTYSGGKIREKLHAERSAPQLGRKSSTFLKA